MTTVMTTDIPTTSTPATKLERIQSYIRYVRGKRSYAEFATDLNRQCSMQVMSAQTLHNWENSRYYPSMDKLKMLLLLTRGASRKLEARKFATSLYLIMRDAYKRRGYKSPY